jgi:protein phosphatase
VANLGDSRAYLVRGGTSRQITEDHAGDMAHGITRFVGDSRGVQPDVFVEELQPGDGLVLCSDGLTRHVDPSELATTLDTSAGTLEAGADALVALANSRGGEDNVTVILFAAGGLTRLSDRQRGTLALGVFIGFVVLVVAGAFAVLFSVVPPVAP